MALLLIHDALPNLARYNTWLAILHLCSLVGIWLLSSSPWPVWVTRARSRWEPLDASSDLSCGDTACRVVVSYESVVQVHVETLVLAFHLPAVLSHAYAARYGYVAWPRVPHRWIEYAVSASIMMVCILLLTGITDLWTLMLAFVCCAATQGMGYVGELHPRRWLYFWLGCSLMAPVWVVVYYSFYSSLADAAKSPPTFVYYIVWTLFVLFMCFAAVNAVQRAYWLTALGAEKWYMVLSLTAKTALAWQIFYGALSREENDLQAYNPGDGPISSTSVGMQPLR